MFILTHNEQYHRFSKLDYAAHFLRQATGKPIRKWMLRDAKGCIEATTSNIFVENSGDR